MEVETTTLWDLLTDKYLFLHLPRFGLFLFIAIPFQIYCDKKRANLACSFATVFLQLCTVIFGLTCLYYLLTSSFKSGYRVPTPIWYYLISLFFLCFPSVFFLYGLIEEIKTGIRRLAVVRTAIFITSLCFALYAIGSPYFCNRIWDNAELFVIPLKTENYDIQLVHRKYTGVGTDQFALYVEIEIEDKAGRIARLSVDGNGGSVDKWGTPYITTNDNIISVGRFDRVDHGYYGVFINLEKESIKIIPYPDSGRIPPRSGWTEQLMNDLEYR